MANKFFIPSYRGASTYTDPLYVDPGSSSTTNLLTFSQADLAANTYWHPLYVNPSKTYAITHLSLTKVKLSSAATLTVRAVVYQLTSSDATQDTYTLVTAGSNQTFTSTSFTELQLPLKTDSTAFTFQPATGNQLNIYLVGFQGTLSTSGSTFQVLYTPNPTLSAEIADDRRVYSEVVNAKTNSIVVQTSTPGATVLSPLNLDEGNTAIPDNDFHFALVGDGPPPSPTFVNSTIGDKTISWNFSMPAAFPDYTAKYLTKASPATTNKADLVNIQTNNVDFSSTVDFPAGLTPGTSYFGQVYVYNTYGESAIVNSTATTAQSVPTISGVTVTQGTGTSANQFTLSVTFNAQSGTMSNISVTPTGESATVVTTSLTSPKSISVTTGWNKTVTFSVTATNNIGTSAVFTTASYTVPVQPQVPNEVTSITATAVAFTPNAVNINWSNPGVPSGSEPITGYKVQRASASKSWNGVEWTFSSPGSYSTIASVGSTTTSYQDTSASPYTAYFYRVLATNATGDGTGTAVGVLTDGGRFFVAGTGGTFPSTGRYMEDPATGSKLRVYRYTGTGEGGWEPTPY